MRNMAGRKNFEKGSYSETLFKRDDGSRIVFYMRPCAEREKVRPLIERGGGKITSKYLFGSIKLAENGAVIKTDDYLAVKYVEDCVQENKLLDTGTYKLKKGKYSSSPKKQTKSLVDDDLEPADVIQSVLCTKSRSSASKATEGRSMYTLEDDMAMLNYIMTEIKYNETGGYQVFREMQAEKVTKHSFMSMHTRFRKQILPNINKYDIPDRWKYLVTGDPKYNKCRQNGAAALFKLEEKSRNQTGSAKKKDLFSQSKWLFQTTDHSDNKFSPKGKHSPQIRNSYPKKTNTSDGKQTSTDKPDVSFSPAKGSKLINDISEVADTDKENKKNKSSKQNKNSVISSDTPKKSKNRMVSDTIEAVILPDHPEEAEYSILEVEENINCGDAKVAVKHARFPGRQHNKTDSSGGLVQYFTSPVKQNEKDSEKVSQAKIQKKGSSDIKIDENPKQNLKGSPASSKEGVSFELIRDEKDEQVQRSRKSRYEPLKFRNHVKQASETETPTESEQENQTGSSKARLPNQQVGNNSTDGTLIACKEQLPTKSSPVQSNRIPLHTKYRKNHEKQNNLSENSVDAGDIKNKVLGSHSESFATVDDAEITLNDSEDDASFISCEDEFDKYLLEKLETSNHKSDTGSDKTQNTCSKDFRKKDASNVNHGIREQSGKDVNSNKEKSPVKRKSDSLGQLESSDEDSMKIKKWRKFASCKRRKSPADPFIDTDSSESAESEKAEDHVSRNMEFRKPQRGKSGAGQNRFVDYSSIDSDLVEDSVEKEEDEVRVEVIASGSGTGNIRSAKNPAPYLEQILVMDVESQTDVLIKSPAAEIYKFQDNDKNALLAKEVCGFLQKTAKLFSLENNEVFEILLSCNGDTRRAVNWIRFGNDSMYLLPWKTTDDKKLMEGEDIVRLEQVYGADEVKERALFLEILERH